LAKKVRTPPTPLRAQGKATEPLISRKLKKRTVPKADGRYIVYYERA
jgi:hypothetical protein